MIYPDKPFYVIEGLVPATHIDFDRFGISVGLKKEFAKMAFGVEISEDGYKRAKETGERIIRAVNLIKPDRRIDLPPYSFVKNEKGNLTFLLSSCDVAGDRCCLHLPYSEVSALQRGHISNLVEYSSHNVDTLQQSHALLALWVTWADSVYAQFNKEVFSDR
jgi:hypothetical protein